MKNKTTKRPYYYGSPTEPIDSAIVQAAVKEIVNTSKKFLRKPKNKIRVLDVGCGRGEYAIEMAKYFGEVVGVEPYTDAYNFAIKSIPKQSKNLKFVNSKIEDFSDRKGYDLIVILTVFEHMPMQDKSFARTLSLLNKNGIIYLTAPNKYWLYEQHYGIPFLSWLPTKIANKYLRLSKKVKSYEDSSYSKGYMGMKRFFDKHKCSYNFILPFDIESAYIGCGNNTPFISNLKKLGVKLIKLNPIFWSLSKGFIMVIRKNS